MNNIQVNVNAEAVLSRVSRMFDNTPESIIREMAQNARRAGASKIHIDLSVDDQMLMEHNGRPLSEDDFRALFSLGDTGWKGKTLNEDPAGSGFFIATLFDTVTIHSRIDETTVHEVCVNKKTLTKIGTDIPIRELKMTLPEMTNVRVLMKGMGKKIEVKHAEAVAHNFPTRIHYTGTNEFGRLIDEDVPSYLEKVKNLTIKDVDVMADQTINGVRFLVHRNKIDLGFPSYSTRHFFYNYHGHPGSFGPDCKGVPMSELLGVGGDSFSKVILCIPQEDSEIKMVLPGRHSIVQDAAYHQMVRDLKKFLADYINTFEEHDLAYTTYEWLGGAKALKKEARIPEFLRNLGKDDVVICGGVCTSVRYMQDVENIRCLYNFPNYSKYKKYTWFDELPIADEGDIRILVDGVDVKEAVFKEMPDSGAVKKIQVMLKDKELAQACSALHIDDECCFVGCMPPDMKFYVVPDKDYDANSHIAMVHTHILENWEPDDGHESDSAETQRREFEDGLMAELVSALDPDNSVLTALIGFFNNHGWAIDNSICEIHFKGREGCKSFKAATTGGWYAPTIEEILPEE